MEMGVSMRYYMWARIRKKAQEALAAVLFAAGITLVLCGLESSTDAAKVEYERIVSGIDVSCTVTNLAGDRSDRLDIFADTISLFTGERDYVSKDLAGLVENVQIKGSTEFYRDGEKYTLAGITSVRVDSNLQPENGCTIFWNEGAEESVFSGNSPVCIIPRALMNKLKEQEMPEDSLPLEIHGSYFETEYEGELEIVGAYQGRNEKTIYCPWLTYVEIIRSMGGSERADSLSATLRRNEDLEMLREIAAEWFAAPDAGAAGLETKDGYYLALDINDSLLTQAKQSLENSMTLNHIAALLVFALSTGVGVLVGFLMIRSRRREIALMRTLGTGDGQIYGSFALEQMVCIVLGTALGGAYFRWQPLMELAIFVGVYFSGLSATLWIFLHKNLITSIKDE